MKEKTRLIALRILLGVVWMGTTIIFTHTLFSFVHEFFHIVPCKLAGLGPTNFHFWGLSCPGIQEKSEFTQFFYFMGPYIFHSFLLVSGYFLASSHFLVKYFLLIPAFDTFFNYVSSFGDSDFKFLLSNTYPNQFPFLISIAFVCFNMFLTVRIILKYKAWAFEEVIERLDKFLT